MSNLPAIPTKTAEQRKCAHGDLSYFSAEYRECESCGVYLDNADNVLTNPIVRRTALRAYPGWEIREYLNGVFDANATNGVGMSPGEATFADALYFVKHGEPAPRA